MHFTAFLANLQNPATPRQTIVALGDSITELTWHTRGHLPWTGLLQEAIYETYGRNRAYVINAGKSGESAQDGLPRLAEDVFLFRPGLVIVSYGMNEARRGAAGLPAFRAAMAEIIAQCRAHDAAVLLRTPNPVICSPLRTQREGLPVSAEMPDMPLAAIAAALVEIGRAQDCPVVDHHTRWLADGFLPRAEEPNTRWLRMSDEIHPGPQGHLAFYRELAPLFGLPERFPWEE